MPGGSASGRDTQSNAVGTMDAVLQARISRDPELSCAGPRPSGPRTSTAKELQKQQRIHSNKRSAIIKEIQQNIKCEKSGLVPCYNYFIVFCEKLELNPRDASTLHRFRKEALDCFIEYGSKHPKSTYKYSMPTLTTSQASSVSAQDQLKRKQPDPSTEYPGVNIVGQFAARVLGQKGKKKKQQFLECRACNDAYDVAFTEPLAESFKKAFRDAGYEAVRQPDRSLKCRYALQDARGERLTQQQLPYHKYFCSNMPRGIFTADTAAKCSALTPCYREKRAEDTICESCETVRRTNLEDINERAKKQDRFAVLAANRVELLVVCSVNGDGICGKDDCENLGHDFHHDSPTRSEAWNRGELALVFISSILMCDPEWWRLGGWNEANCTCEGACGLLNKKLLNLADWCLPSRLIRVDLDNSTDIALRHIMCRCMVLCVGCHRAEQNPEGHSHQGVAAPRATPPLVRPPMQPLKIPNQNRVRPQNSVWTFPTAWVAPRKGPNVSSK